MKNKKLFKSFSYAIDGLLTACKNERNLRFHLSAVNLTCVFASFYGIDRTGWAILVTVFALVVSAELFNTAVENAIDTATEEIKPTAKLAKDAAAAGVLITAVGAVLAGVCLFGDIEKITYTLKTIFQNIKWAVPIILLIVFDLWFFIGFNKKEKGN